MESQLLHKVRELLDVLERSTGEPGDLTSTLQHIVQTAQKFFAADTCDIFAIHPITNQFVASQTIPVNMIPNQPSAQLEEFAQQVLRRGIVVVEDLEAMPEYRDTFTHVEGIHSFIALALGMKDQQKPLGVLYLNFKQRKDFTPHDYELLHIFAEMASFILKETWLLQRYLDELEMLQHIDRELSRTLLDLEAFLNTLLKHAQERVPAEEASILLYNPHTQDLEILATIGLHAEARLRHSISIHEAGGITHWVFEHKQPARVDNVHLDPQWQKLYIEGALDTVSELDVPLLDAQEVVGVLNFESTKDAAFSQQDEDFLITLAGQVVLAIKNAQAYEREKRLVKEERVLNQISKEITSHLDRAYIFNLILDRAIELTHSSVGSLHLYNPELKDLRMVAERGVTDEKKGQRQTLDQGIVGYVAAHMQPKNVEDVTQYPWNDIYMEISPGIRSELTVPMMAGNELRGVLNVESPLPKHFTENDERLLQELADLAVVALQNTERYEQAKREAQRFALWYRAEQELDKLTDMTQLEQAYDIILHIAGEHSQSQVAIRRYYPDTQELVVIRNSEPQSPLFPRQNLDVGVNGQVARELRTLVVHDTQDSPPDIAPAHLPDPTIRSLLITPIMFKNQYYGNLGLRHKDIGYFEGADITFFEGLAQQLATTIYRLETTQERQEFEQKALSAEIMSSIGQVSFELTHRWGNDLGLVEPYVNDIRLELEARGAVNPTLSKKLDNIVRVTRRVLDISRDLKQALALGTSSEPEVVPPKALFDEAIQAVLPLPSTIQIDHQINENVARVQVFNNLVVDILRNLLTNAIEAMPKGGRITLSARNNGRFVAMEVTDTGIGIPPQQQSKIFELSFSTKKSSGFGLWSARTNALKNHGDLTVKSELGQGTSFTLLLPRAEKGLS